MSAAPEIEFGQASVAQRMRDVREAARSVSEGFCREYMRECIDNHRFPIKQHPFCNFRLPLAG